MREALLLDLGALVYELHRHGRREPELLQAKAAELTAVDQEVRGLAEALDADESVVALVAAGIAGSCETCGSLLSTDARYCGACGTPAVEAIEGPTAPAGPALAQPQAEPGVGEHPPPAPAGFHAATAVHERPGAERPSDAGDGQAGEHGDDGTYDDPYGDPDAYDDADAYDDPDPYDEEPVAPWLAELDASDEDGSR